MRRFEPMAGITGELSVMSLADVLIWMANRGKSGLLVVEHDYARKEISVQSGSAVRASSNNPREYLGQLLIKFGLVTEEQLLRAFEVQHETKVLLGRILVMIGIVQEEQVIAALALKIRETILDALRHGQGRFVFHEGVRAKDGPQVEVSVPLIEIHREGAHRAPLWEAFLSVFPSQRMILAVDERRMSPVFEPHTVEGRIIAAARRGSTIEKVGNELGLFDFHLYGKLYELLQLGALVAQEPAAKPGSIAPVLARPPPKGPPPPPTGPEELVEEPIDLDEVSTVRPRGEPSLPVRDVASLGVEPFTGFDRDTPASGIPIQARLGDGGAVPILLRPLEDILRVRTSVRERYILTRIDGQKTIEALLQLVPMRDYEALEILRSLAHDGLIRY